MFVHGLGRKLSAVFVHRGYLGFNFCNFSTLMTKGVVIEISNALIEHKWLYHDIYKGMNGLICYFQPI